MPTASAAPVLLLPSGHPAPIAAPRSTSRRGRGTLAARYDAAQTTADNRNHWAAADSLSPDAAANPFVRKKLRDRSRYEAANNCNLRRMLRTQAKGIIGTGPRLQMLTPDENLNRQIEKSWQLWAKAVNFSAKLRTMRETRAKDGEVFATITNNPGVRNPIKVDINLHEADMITSDILTTQIQDNEVDGIKYDRYGNPAEYRLLKYHPGSQTYFSVIQDAVWVKAKDMIHYFIEERPGQHRGVPEITPALPLFAQLRRYTLAVISAAETAADFSAILYTDASPDEEAEPSDPFDEVEIGRNTMTTMPMGWKMSQFEPTQPTTAYSDFKREIINDIAGVLELPYNVAAGNSSDYNYASGRLDFQDYYKTICVDREFTENVVIEPIFKEFMIEFSLINGVLAKSDLPHQWFWDGMEHVDPKKEAEAQKIRLGNGTTNQSIEYARQGRDWETERRQAHKEKMLEIELEMELEATKQKLMKKYKITEDPTNENK